MEAAEKSVAFFCWFLFGVSDLGFDLGGVRVGLMGGVRVKLKRLIGSMWFLAVL